MAFSLIANAGAASSDDNTVTTGAIDTSGADLLVASVSSLEAGPATLTDSKSNTWTALTLRSIAGGQVRMYWCVPSSVGSGHTFTASQAGSFPAVFVEAWSGAHASPYDQESGDAQTGTTIAPGSITPSVDNALVATGAFVGSYAAGSLSVDGGFTISNQANSSANAYGGGLAYLVQTSAAAANPTWTRGDGGGAFGAAMASFKPSTAPPAVNRRRRMLFGSS